MIQKDGHTDVASSRRMCKTIIEDAEDILSALPRDAEASLPTWWTNKLATTAAYINSARDFVYVDDTVNALIKVALRGENGEVYNVANGKSFTIKQIIKYV